MAVDIHVRNFQSLKDTKIRVSGFTAVTGPNNSGKTALMRGVRGVFQNTPGTSFVREGAQECVIGLRFDDGQTLVWKKGTTKRHKPTYVVNGGKPIHPGRGVPDEVKAFGVLPIKVMGQEVWPTLAPQFTGQVFLLDQPGSSLAEAVADVDRVTKLNGALRSADHDRRQAQATLKVRRADIARLEESLESYAGLNGVVARVGEIEKAQEKAGKYGRVIDKITDLRDRLAQAHSQVEALEGVEEVAVPDPGGAERDLRTLEVLRPLRDRLARARSQVGSLEGVGQVSCPKTGGAPDILQKLEDLRSLGARLQSARAEVETLEGAERLKLDGAGSEQVEKTLTVLGVLLDLRARKTAAEVAVADLTSERGRLQTEAEVAETAVKAAFGSFEECPVCGAALDSHKE